MGHAARQPAMTAAEFLAWEADQAERHEFVSGEVFAMAARAPGMRWWRAISTWRCASTCAARHAGRS